MLSRNHKTAASGPHLYEAKKYYKNIIILENNCLLPSWLLQMSVSSKMSGERSSSGLVFRGDC